MREPSHLRLVSPLPTPVAFSRDVYVAQGMVCLQASCSLEAAWRLLERVACDTATPIEDVAHQVLEGRFCFGPR